MNYDQLVEKLWKDFKPKIKLLVKKEIEKNQANALKNSMNALQQLSKFGNVLKGKLDGNDLEEIR